MRRLTRGRLAFFQFFLVLAWAPGWASPATGANAPLSPYFAVDSKDAAPGSFPLRSTQVVAYVNGVMADVYVTQTYANDGVVPIHATYVFPGSTRAAIHGLRVRIGDEVVAAKIREREAARREFEAAKSAGKSASLLEQQRPNVFTMKVANILPADQVEVELHYTELLVPTDGTYQFVYPTVVGPRYAGGGDEGAVAAAAGPAPVAVPYSLDGAAPAASFEMHVTLAPGMPIEAIESKSHALHVERDGPAVARISLPSGTGPAADRDFVLDYHLAGKAIRSGLLLHEGADESFFLLTIQPPERPAPSEIVPREYIFVVDVSGSMAGFPLDTAKALLHDLVDHLKETDLFDVVLFSGRSATMALSSVPATAANVGEAMRTIDGCAGGGGTELGGAIDEVARIPRRDGYARSVVVVTDGYISAEADIFERIRSGRDHANYFAFGIGSAVNRYLIEGIARAGGGEPFIVTDAAAAPGEAARFRTSIDAPVLTKIELVADGFDVHDLEPESIPDLFAGRPIVVVGKWRGSRSGTIGIRGRTAAGAYARSFRVADVVPSEENSALRYQWARAAVARLSEDAYGRETPEAAQKVTALGLTYSLLTRHTSFVAVLEKVRKFEGAAKEVSQPLPLPQGVSAQTVGAGYAMGAEPELWLLLALAGALAAALALWRRR